MRALALIVVLAAGIAGVVAAGGGGGDSPPRYWLELDSAFGLVEDGDVRVAGVNAGTVRTIELDERTLKARVEIEVVEEGFGSLRRDAFCETRPQSPLGEYFVDCSPGTGEALARGATLPVRRTASTIPNDLVMNVWRLPYRERLRLIIGEFGAGLAGRGDDLNDAIRRAVPALRQTERLLAILADHDRVIQRLITDADRVLGELARGRRDVGRFVGEARDTARASAARSDDLAANWRALPGFLEELRPTMASLGQLADEQLPVLRDLDASAGELRRFLGLSREFSHASRPSIRALADLARVGRRTVRAARPVVRDLRAYAQPLPEWTRNLRILSEDFSDPARAVEPDPRSPGGRGFSGSQALLAYIFNQSQQANAFDVNGYLSRVSLLFDDHCADFADAAMAREPERQHCRSWLGPTQPGVTVPWQAPGRDIERHDAGGERARGAERAGGAERRRGGGAHRPAARERAARRPAAGEPTVRDESALLDYLLAP